MNQLKKDSGEGGLSKLVIERLECSLSSMALTARHEFPELAGIYLVQSSEGRLLHIGRTNDLKQTWKSHPRLGDLLAIDPESRVFWLEVDHRLVIDESLVGPMGGEPTATEFVPVEIFSEAIANLTLEVEGLKKPALSVAGF
jgi:hypothetical protein